MVFDESANVLCGGFYERIENEIVRSNPSYLLVIGMAAYPNGQ